MKSITIQEWVDALRSGEYKQGKHVLRSTRDEFCCLGVACDLLDIGWLDDPITVTVHPSVENEEGEIETYDQSINCYLPIDSRTIGASSRRGSMVAQMPSEEIEFPLAYREGPWEGDRVDIVLIAEMNDSGSSFEEIADTILKYADPNDKITFEES